MKKKTEDRKKAEEARRQQIRRRYEQKIVRTKTIRDCEDILRELVRDEEIPTSEYWNVYRDLEARARRIKQNQEAILKETAAAKATMEKMAPHYRA